MVHLVYCDDKEKVYEKITEGKRTMVVRGAAARKIPHSRVFEGEQLYFMKRGTAKITAKAVVKSVQNFVKLTEQEALDILKDNQDKLNLTDKEFERWMKKCLIIVEFENVQEIEPMIFDHQRNMDDWLILEKIEDVVAGTSIKFSYEKARFER